MSEPVVSVIVPAFNAMQTLADAIESIHAEDVPVEVIVVDDGSTDGTAEWLATRTDLTVIHQENRGPAAARNRGIATAGSPYIAFLDADDVWVPGKLARQLELLETRPEIALTIGYSAIRALDPSTSMWRDVADPHLLFHLGAALVRRSLFERFGVFDESLQASEDVDWFLRVRDAGERIEITRDTVQVHRRNGLNMTRGKDLRDLQFIEVLKRSMDRRRAEGTR